MSEATTDQTTDNKAQDIAIIKAQDLATLVSRMSRFLTRLANAAPFRETGLGLAEWSALSIIASKGGLHKRRLANGLGISVQRVNQMTDSLSRAGHISLNSSADDGHKKGISITPSGTALLNRLNAKLDPIIVATIKRPVALKRASRFINKAMMNIAAKPTSGKSTTATPAERNARIAAEAAKSAERQAAASK